MARDHCINCGFFFYITELKCAKCNQVFKHEYPYLAHCRFLCAQLKGDAWSHDTCGQKDANKLMEIKRQRRVTDFHNIARDLEHNKPSTDEDAETSPNKRKCEESVYPKGRKSVLLETTNIANDHNITPSARDYEPPSLDSPSLTLKLRADKLKAPHIDGRFTHDRDRTPEMDGGSGGGGGLGAAPLRSAFSALSPSGHGEQKSAFCKPSKRTYNEATLHPSIMAQATSSSSRLDGLSGAFTPVTVTGYTTTTPSLMAPSRSLVTGELPTHVAINNAFHYHGPEHWSRNMTSQLRTTSSLAVLPPTFTLVRGVGPELVRQVQPVLQDDLRPRVPHALPPQEGVRGGVPGEEEAGGEAHLPDLPRVLPRAAPPLPTHDFT